VIFIDDPFIKKVRMKNYLKIFFAYLILSIIPIRNSYSQTISNTNDFLKQNFIVSLESGINYGFTDYKTSNFEPGVRGSIEYFPLITQKIRIGLKLFGGGARLGFSDSRGSISNNDQPNPREIPQDIYTDMVQIGSCINIGFSLGESLIPYLGIGAAYLQFSPKNSEGTILSFNSQDKYDKNIFTFVLEGGIKFRLSDRFGLNAAVSYYPTSTDYLEDVSASKSKDSFLSGFIGVSYAFTGRFDNDDDGIDNNKDLCPDDPEDFDGFEDQDGCPDLDNDKDGILDVNDKCPNDAEDIDSFHDEDGCPDPDNDGDGILDINDKCPNDAEDIDSFHDEDGCPDPDNDGDGILDINDKCPDTPINTKVDSTGCSETNVEQEETFYQFILRGDDTFEPNSAAFIESSKILLKEIATYLKSQSGSKWRIEGHTDNQGSTSLLKKLSYERAKAVYDYLISENLPPEQFSVYGLGNSSPIANNNTSEGRSTNRRIIIIRED
jgi:outer membrane protein OmpA-like peptidoglycan-associated protein/opacity protein-like surface antigen